MLIEWVKALVPVAVAVIPVIITTIASARGTRKDTASRIEAVETKLDKHIQADEWAEMKQRRVRILRFADEVSNGKTYSSDYWSDVLDDIDEYEKYCDSHKDYHNNKGQCAMEYIKCEYKKLKGANNGKSQK